MKVSGKVVGLIGVGAVLGLLAGSGMVRRKFGGE